MYLTGFADEAANGIDGQIKAVKELGWSNIEARSIDGVNIHDLSDEQFDDVHAADDRVYRLDFSGGPGPLLGFPEPFWYCPTVFYLRLGRAE